ncbi:uncharacterized protein [Physcomitrium patens]|uniref:uncharacterized protein isoform X5 n=1 Tax=Physcomitrium patens TaxID=3218 RepID=UPI000D17CFAB|nr:uncharacterized protein LOC112285155 [Physcomitrium patens]XP_024381513.1 uncharacterized protein LOC112285155 [Physcomitrium patens]|eukprot:XP_024381512.1 uncharacterized protein LOC112285155 [Physcomitrella patens]
MACNCCEDDGKDITEPHCQEGNAATYEDASGMKGMTCGFSMSRGEHEGQGGCDRSEECFSCASTDGNEEILFATFGSVSAACKGCWGDIVEDCKNQDCTANDIALCGVEDQCRKQHGLLPWVIGDGSVCQAVPKSCLKTEFEGNGADETKAHALPRLTMVDPQLRSGGLMAPPPSGAASLRRLCNALQCALRKRVESERHLKMINKELKVRLEKCLLELDVDSVQLQLDTLSEEMKQTIYLLRKLAEKNAELERQKVVGDKKISALITELQLENASLKRERSVLFALLQSQRHKLQSLRSDFIPRSCVVPGNSLPDSAIPVEDVKDLHEEVDRSASQKESDIYQSIVEDECRRNA